MKNIIIIDKHNIHVNLIKKQLIDDYEVIHYESNAAIKEYDYNNKSVICVVLYDALDFAEIIPLIHRSISLIIYYANPSLFLYQFEYVFTINLTNDPVELKNEFESVLKKILSPQ